MKMRHHDLSTSLLLRSRLLKALRPSIMMTGTIRENMIATIIPGTMKQMKPRIINVPEIKAAPSRGASLWIVKLNALLRFASPFSKRSDAYLTAIPLAIVIVVQKKNHSTDVLPRTTQRTLINHSKKFSVISSSGVIDGNMFATA